MWPSWLSRHPLDHQISMLRLPLWTSLGKAEPPAHQSRPQWDLRCLDDHPARGSGLLADADRTAPVKAGRRVGLCSTITVLAVPAPPLVTICPPLRGGSDFNSSARTSSTGSSISEAAISACC